MDEIREFDGILNKEDGRVVAHQVVIPLPGIEFGGESADVPHRIGIPGIPARWKNAQRLVFFLTDPAERPPWCTWKGICIPENNHVPRNLLREPLVPVSAPGQKSHFFQKVKVFQQGGASAACLERVLIIGYFYSEVGGKGLSHAVVAHGIQVFDFFRGVFRPFHGAGGGRFRVGRSGFGRRLDQFRINGVRIMGFRLFPVREGGEPVLHLLGLFFSLACF